MMENLGGPESPEKILERQARYVRLGDSGKGRMFKIVDGDRGEAAGSVGYWERTRRGDEVYFTLVEEREFEYPPGSFMQCNDWRLDLFTRRSRERSRHSLAPSSAGPAVVDPDVRGAVNQAFASIAPGRGSSRHGGLFALRLDA